MLPCDGATEHLIGHYHVGQPGLVYGQALGIDAVERREVQSRRPLGQARLVQQMAEMDTGPVDVGDHPPGNALERMD